MQIQCPRCKGTGKDPEIIAECGLCQGRGHILESDKEGCYRLGSVLMGYPIPKKEKTNE